MNYKIMDVQAEWIHVMFTDESNPQWAFSVNVSMAAVNLTDAQIKEEIAKVIPSAEQSLALSLDGAAKLPAIRERLVGADFSVDEIKHLAPATSTPPVSNVIAGTHTF